MVSFWDTTGDNALAPLDVLKVIDFLNRNDLNGLGIAEQFRPVPEPSTWIMLAIGLLAASFRIRRKAR